MNMKYEKNLYMSCQSLSCLLILHVLSYMSLDTHVNKITPLVHVKCNIFNTHTPLAQHALISVQEESSDPVCLTPLNSHIDITKVQFKQFNSNSTEHRHARVRNRSTRLTQPLPMSF